MEDARSNKLRAVLAELSDEVGGGLVKKTSERIHFFFIGVMCYIDKKEKGFAFWFPITYTYMENNTDFGSPVVV